MEDFLEVDTPIPGQNYACMSFLSPEKTLKSKDLFFFSEYVRERFGEEKAAKVEEDYADFLCLKQTELEAKFYEDNKFQTTIRGLKVRGVYDTIQEAQSRAKTLQKNDPSFHVYVGAVGYWLPWDPTADAVTDQVYQEEALNQLMSQYKENEVKRDTYYQQQKEQMKQKALEENAMKKSALAAATADTPSHTELKEAFERATVTPSV